MKMPYLFTLRHLVLCAALGALPAAYAAEPSAAPDPATARDNEEICKSTIVTGSRFKKKVCKTRAEWEAEAESAQEYMKGADRQREKFQPLDPNARGG